FLNTWDVTTDLTAGTNTLSFTKGTSYAYKTTLATLAVKYPEESSGANPPVASFLTNKQAGTAPLEIQFTDQSATDPTTWAWDFDNNGIVDSTDQSPTFSYHSAGVYTVNLTVTNATGTSTIVKENAVAVSDGPD